MSIPLIFGAFLCVLYSAVAVTDHGIVFPTEKPYESSEYGNIIFPKERRSDGKISYPESELVQSENEESTSRHENNFDHHQRRNKASHNNAIEWEQNDRKSNDQTKSEVGRPNRNRKQRRLCEQKYMEYMTRIFRDEETVADSTDDDFNGRVLAGPGEYPHMTALGFTSEGQSIDYKCGGSLISDKFVITAAHCTNITGEEPAKIRIGDLNLLVEERYLVPQIRNIRRIYTHPDYRNNLYYNDIALLELDEEVELTEFIRPIKLWVRMDFPANVMAYAMGYGATAFGKARTNRLTDLNLTIVPNDVCNTDLPEMPETPSGIIYSQICAQDFVLNRDTCQGDSGGPLQFNLHGRRRRNRKHFHLIGITSYGLFCRSGSPSIYTRVSAFLDWIENIVWAN